MLILQHVEPYHGAAAGAAIGAITLLLLWLTNPCHDRQAGIMLIQHQRRCTGVRSARIIAMDASTALARASPCAIGSYGVDAAGSPPAVSSTSAQSASRSSTRSAKPGTASTVPLDAPRARA